MFNIESQIMLNAGWVDVEESGHKRLGFSHAEIANCDSDAKEAPGQARLGLPSVASRSPRPQDTQSQRQTPNIHLALPRLTHTRSVPVGQ